MFSGMRFSSLRMRLSFWFVSVTMLCLLAVVTTLYFQRAAVIRGREFEKLETVRDLKLREVNNWLEERASDVALFARDHEVRLLNETLGKPASEWTPDELQTAANVRALLARRVESYRAYHEVFIVGVENGSIVISSNPDREGQDKRTYPYFTEPLRTQALFIQDIYDSKTERKPAMAFSAPIFCDAHDGEHPVGVMVARADLEHVLYPLLQQTTGLGSTGETVLVNHDGFAINELRWAENAPLRQKITAPPAARALAGETGIAETTDYRDEPVLAAFAPVPLMGWGFVVKRDQTEVYAVIRAMLGDMSVILVIAGVVVLAVSLFLAGTVAKPILAMSETVRSFADGDLEVRSSSGGSDEVADLGDAFNEMAASLSSQLAIQQGSSQIGDALTESDNIAGFASSLVRALLDVSGSHLGALYLLSQDSRTFEQVASVGLTGGTALSFDAESHEGEIGKALATGDLTVIEDVSQATVFTFRTTAGTAIPRQIITVPLYAERKIAAVVSLATLGSYSDVHREVIAQAQVAMDVALANVLSNERTRELAEELEARNEELQAQTEELQEQTEELELQRQQVEGADRLKSEFLSNMSHELRTPLNSIIALSQLMISRGTGQKPDKDAEYLRIVEQNGQHLLSLINDILDLAKIEAGRADLAIATFDPRTVLEAVVATTRSLAGPKDLEVSLRAEDVPMMRSDVGKIHQILLNLASNAVKFTETGSVTFELSGGNQGVAFSVADTGIGIPEEELGTIFEEFRQVDGSSTRRHEGTGLGLSICQKLAHLLGGAISVESTLGGTSRFTLNLPLTISPPSDASGANSVERPRPAASEGAAPAPTGGHILVVEDNEVAALQVRSAIEDRGYEVRVADSGEGALTAILSDPPALVVLDLMMPEMNGFQVLATIRSHAELAQLPVVVLTAKELSSKERSELASNNIQELVQKGELDRDQLVALIETVLHRDLPQEDVAEPKGESALLEIPPDKTILVVEDNPDNLFTAQELLAELGCKSIAASDGRSGIETARSERPDLILMDVQLPGLTGTEATKEIKAIPALQHVPIIAVTALAMKGDRENILAAGCDDYLAKPLSLDALRSTLHKWLA